MTQAGAGRGGASQRFARWTRADCRKIHEASLQILERTGVRLLDEEALAMLRRAGARVDGDRARLPARLVESALSTVPRSMALYDRRGEPALLLEGANTYFGPGSDCLNIIDHRTGQRRRPLLQDVSDAVTLCDALPHIDFVMSVFLPADVPPELADRYQAEIMLSRTTKPVVFVSYEIAGCRDVVEMAEAVAGSREALARRPFVAGYINVATGLLHNADALQKLLFLVDRGIPALYIPVASGGTTAPMTMAGGVAASNAGVLVGLVLSQLRREGASIGIPGFAGDALDMRTMVDPYCAPEPRGLAEALGHYYGIPIFTLGGASEAKTVDQQASAEAALTMMVAAVSGGHLFHDLGYLESGLTGSLAQLAICNEIAGWIRAFRQQVEISEETLALDLIDRVGPDGSFLTQPHTRRHVRERWYPTLFERESHGGWLARGGEDLGKRASRQVSDLLASHQPAPLAHGVIERLRSIRARAGEAPGAVDRITAGHSAHT